jgi:hypothetical protein
MSKLQESKNQIATQSPAPPMTALLKRDSSVGENPFGNPITPNRNDFGQHSHVIGLCK